MTVPSPPPDGSAPQNDSPLSDSSDDGSAEARTQSSLLLLSVLVGACVGEKRGLQPVSDCTGGGGGGECWQLPV